MLTQSIPQTTRTVNREVTVKARIWYRDPGIYGVYPPALVKATVMCIRDHWSGKRLMVQPDGMRFARDIALTDVRSFVWGE